MKNQGKKKPWVRKRPTRQQSLLNLFVSNGYGSGAKNVVEKANSNANHGITAQEITPYIRENIQRVRDARDIYNIIPDLKHAAALGTSTILSTDDLITISLIYESSSDRISLEMKSRLSAIIEDYFKNTLRFNEKLYDIVYEMRYVSGSYPLAILPEASINDIINGDLAKVKTRVGTEAYDPNDTITVKNRGILGDPNSDSTKLGIERYFRKPQIGREDAFSVKETKTLHDICPEFDESPINIDFTLTDNIQVLRLPDVKREFDHECAYAAMGMEDFSVPRSSSYYDAIAEEKPDIDFFKSKTFKYQHIAALKATNMTSRVSRLHPTLMDLPAESVIMVHSPGTYTKPIGALVLLDELGYAISESNHYTNVISNFVGRNLTSVNIDSVAKATGVAKNRVFNWTERRLADLTRDLVTTKFVNSIKNGNYGHDNIELADSDSFIRTMLAAALSNKSTQLLFIPSEQITYFATEFDENGIGISIVESSKILASMCVGNKFAAMHAAINNARSITTATITLDPDDRDPEQKIEDLKTTLSESINQQIPLTGSADDWNKHLAGKGMVFSVEGNEHYPSTKVEISTDNSRFEYPDETQTEKLNKDLYTAFGVNPAVLADGGPVETATQITVKDLHHAKMAMTEQGKLSPLLTHFVRNYLYSDPIMLDKLAKEVEEVIKERIDAKAISRKRVAEAEAAEELNDAKKDDAAQENTDTEQAETSNEETDTAEEGSEAPKGSVEQNLENSSEEFVFESVGGVSIRRKVGRESFVDFYNIVDKMTPDTMEEMHSPKAIKAVLSEYLSTLSVNLPGPENAKLESSIEQLESRAEHLNKIAEFMWPDGLFPDDSSLSGREDRLRKLWVSYEITNYMRRNNICDSAINILEYRENNETLHEIIEDMVDRGIGGMTMMKNILQRLDTHAETLDLVNDDSSGGDYNSGGDNNDSNDEFGSDTDSDSQSDDEFSFDDDVGGGEGSSEDDGTSNENDSGSDESNEFSFDG